MKDDFRTKILKEIETWQKEGLVSETQAEKLSSRYSLSVTSEKSALAKIITILSTLGSVLVGVGVILFFSSNWRGIPKEIKLLFILLNIIGTYSIGYNSAYIKRTYLKTGKAFILLGSILFGAGIYLVAQIYHFPSNFPSGVLFWALGILAIAYILRLNSILFLSSILLILWNILRMTGLDQPNYFYLPLFVLVFFLVYKFKSSRLIFVNLLGLIIWFISYFYYWTREWSMVYNALLLLNLGILFYISGKLHENSLGWDIFKFPYKFLGVFLVFFSTYVLTYDNIYLDVSKISSPIIVINSIIFVFAITMLVFNFFRTRQRDKMIAYESYFLAIIILLSLIYLIFPQTLSSYRDLKNKFLLYPFIFNIVLFLEVLAVISLGYFRKEIYLVNLSIITFVVHMLTLYFGTCWELLPRSLFFILFGLILLLGGSFLERKRKLLIARIKSMESV